MYPNNSCSMKQIPDGTSKTVALAEVRADPDAAAGRGVWGLQGCGGALYGHGCNNFYYLIMGNNGTNWLEGGLDIGPNNGGGTISGGGGDVAPGCQTNFTQAQLIALGMGCIATPINNNSIIGPKSLHPGGVQSVFCDGSVHWLDDSIQVGTPPAAGAGASANGTLGYWEMLFLVADGLSLPQEIYSN
jgi:prepilin-type processing-associated H-X9-DG protein